MRRPILILSLALAASLAACSSSAGPAWTYAPPTEAPASQPAASGGASGAPSSAPSSAPSAATSAAPSGEAPSGEAPSGGAGGVVVNLEAEQVNFVEKELSAPADQPFTIHFDNKDPMQHNVEIKDAGGQTLWKGDLVTGPIQTDYAVTPLAAGTYTYICILHANMTGTLTVGG